MDTGGLARGDMRTDSVHVKVVRAEFGGVWRRVSADMVLVR